MTALLLLLASAPGGVSPQGELSSEEAIGKARARATSLGLDLGNAPGEATRRDPISGPLWHVEFSPAGAPNDGRIVLEIERETGRLKSLTDTTFTGNGLKAWTPRIARTQARAKTIAFARTLGFPSSWVVGRTAFDGTGLNRWPEEAHATFEERPLGYRFLTEGNRAIVRLNPRTGALVGYELTDDFKTERAPIRFRTGQAESIARKWRTTERTDIRPRVEGATRLGWAPIVAGSRTTRLVFDVPFRIETHWVDANNGRVVGGRRTKAVTQ